MYSQGPLDLTHTDRPLKRRRAAPARVVPRRAERGISQDLTAQSRGPFGKQSFTRLLLDDVAGAAASPGFNESSVVDQGDVGEGIAFLPRPYTVDALGQAVRLILDKRA